MGGISNLDDVLLSIDSEQLATKGNYLNHSFTEAHKLSNAQEGHVVFIPSYNIPDYTLSATIIIHSCAL